MVSKGLILGMVAGLGVILYAVTMSSNNAIEQKLSIL